jgi:lipocalin
MKETFIQEGKFPNGQRHYSLKKDRLVGIVESNREEDGTPVLIVDGKAYTWEEIGKMLMSYEGFQLKVEAVDIFDEIEWIDEE